MSVEALKDSATGVIVRDSGSSLKAFFIIQGFTYELGIVLDRPIQPFTSIATLHYDDVKHLEDSDELKKVLSFIGESKLQLALGKGPIIEGTLNKPHLTKKNDVSGKGNWKHSY